jgi:hypothetical protein
MSWRRRAKNHVLDAAFLACYTHVGDALFIGRWNSGHNKAVLAMQQAADDMVDLGFNVNDMRAGDELDKIVGYKFVPKPAQLRVPDDKWVRTHASLLFLAGQRKVGIELSGSSRSLDMGGLAEQSGAKYPARYLSSHGKM